MIPTIGIMVGCYIVFRAAELLSRPGTEFTSRGAQRTMDLLAILLICITVLCMLGLLGSSSQISLK